MISKLSVEPSRLEGTVHVSGAKNSALKLLTLSLLTGERVRLRNYPAALLDARTHVNMLEVLNKQCVVAADTVTITEPVSLSSDLAWPGRSIRNTLLMLGALVARTGSGAVPLPGGCEIGERKFDLHELLLREMGARVWQSDGLLRAEADGRLRGAHIDLPVKSTGATENALLCGSLASGTTRITNPHITPEVLDLVACLRAMGADITVRGREYVEIEGRRELDGVTYDVMPDRMEAVTWAIAAVVTGGVVELYDFPYAALQIPLVHLVESGTQLYRGEHSVIVKGSCSPIDIGTGSHPAVHSDMQPMFAVYGACANGESRVMDLRYPGRFAYVAELARLGVRADVEHNLLRIKGGSALRGAPVRATDLRAGAALLLAGLVAEGETEIDEAWQIERGYADIVDKLQSLGVRVKVE